MATLAVTVFISMLSLETKQRIQALYSECVKTLNLNPRYGQRAMIAEIAKTLAAVHEGDDGGRDNDAGIAVIEAGTGTGKTLAYLIATLPIAQEREKKLIVSTATVALQEQILNKDLPNLKQAISLPFSFALAKGRGRYLCLAKLEKGLEQLAGKAPKQDLFEQTPQEQDQALFSQLLSDYASGRWDGDRDRLDEEVAAHTWSMLTATHRECSKRRCPHFDNCAFYRARAAVDSADIVVANHDLVLADLSLGGGAVLPAPAKSIYIFDEGHHLADKALGHFLHDVGVKGQRQWLQQLEKGIESFIGDTGVPASLLTTFTALPQQIKETLQGINLAVPLLQDVLGSDEFKRFEQGQVPQHLRDLLHHIKTPVAAIANCLESLSELLQKSLDSRGEGEFSLQVAENWHAPFALWLARAETLNDALRVFCAEDKEGEIPVARWVKRIDVADTHEFHISASPISIADELRRTLWWRCYGAVVTSATLTALNSFYKLSFESGLPAWANYQRVASPFNYPELGELEVAAIHSEPNHPQFQQDVEQWLVQSLDLSQASLVLFSSRAQLEATRDTLLGQWREQLLCQGFLPKAEIVRRHKERIDQGQGSVIFGLASFAEGIDLPGDYLQHVVIVKIPFAVPDDPIHAATSEWLESQGKNPFMELTLPAASVRLVQACGRLVRTETDRGRISILDKRLSTKRYGSTLINALPPFKRIR